MRIRKEQFAALGAPKAAQQRQELLESFRAKGLEAKEVSSGGDILVRDPLGSETRMHGDDSGLTITTAERREMKIVHDGHGQLRRVTDPAGFAIELEYDKKGRLNEVRRGSHSKYGFAYDEFDGVTEIRYPDGTATNFVNDGTGNVLKTIDRNKNISRRGFDTQGRLTKVSDWQGNETEYRYKGFDLPAEVVHPHGTVQQFVYSDEGDLTSMSVNGQEHARFSRSDDDGTYRIDYADGTFVSLKQKNNLVTEAENGNSKLVIEYDGEGRIVKEDTNGRVVEYVRDEGGNLQAIVAPDGKRITFGRDREHRVNQITDWNGKLYAVEYHLNGGFKSLRFPNGASVEQEVTPIGLPQSLTIKSPRHSMRPLVENKYDYDVCDRLTREQSESGELRYSYDLEGRLLAAADSSGERSEQFRLDANGNRVADETGTCTYNGVNQLTQREGKAFAYDLLGNLTQGAWSGKEYEFKYNGRGQVVQAMTSLGKVEYEYDGIGRRILKRFAGKTTRYIWAGSQLLCEIIDDGSSRRQRDYLFFAGKPLPVAMLDGDKTYYFHCGRRCEPLAMTDDAGKLVWQADYNVSGKATITEHAHRHQPFRLAGQYYDEETGLHYNVARYYVPELGRFLTQDPLREGGGSLNLYSYCDGDPLNRLDPDGELIFLAIVVGAVIGAAIAGGIEYYRQKKAVERGEQKEVDGWKVAGAAVVGGIVGAVGGGVGAAVELGAVAVLGTGIAASAGVGAISGVVSSVAEQCVEASIKKEELNPLKIVKQAAIDGLIGAVIGAVTAGVGGALARRARKGATEATEEVLETAAQRSGKEGASETAEEFADKWCFAPRTLVATGAGKKPISLIEPGEHVFAFDYDQGQWVLEEVMRRHSNSYTGEMYLIYVAGEAIEVTINHPFWIAAGVGLAERRAAEQFGLECDHGKTLTGRWINSQHVQIGDLVICHDGATRPVERVAVVWVNEATVCNLSIRHHHTFAVGECSLLVHNKSWCDILEEKGRKKPQALVDMVEQGKVISSEGKKRGQEAIHGHHIVMKKGGGEVGDRTRQMLDDYDIPLLDTHQKLIDAPAEEMHNMAMALNGHRGIHSDAYAKAVHDRLADAIEEGGTKAQIRQRMTEELAKMRQTLESGNIFWPE